MADGGRDEFPLGVKRALAERVAYRCSHPSCRVLTVGPSDEKATARSMTGVAAHIAGASDGPGSRRYDSAMTPDERSSIDNGIWLCQNHARLIDTDEMRFPATMLHHWRRLAELKCRIEQESGRAPDSSKLELRTEPLAANHIVVPGLGIENELIGDALEDCALDVIWGPEITYAARDFLIEWTRNAFRHGLASKVRIDVSAHAITVDDDGEPFSPYLLIEEQGGGAAAARHLIRGMGRLVMVACQRTGSSNLVTLSLPATAQQVTDVTPCAFVLDRTTIYQGTLDVERFGDCSVLYVVLPKYFVISDIAVLKQAVVRSLGNRQLVFVAQATSPQVITAIGVVFENATILDLPA